MEESKEWGLRQVGRGQERDGECVGRRLERGGEQVMGSREGGLVGREGGW